eukprot:1016179-Alexandrium_andersonii.AAC.1
MARGLDAQDVKLWAQMFRTTVYQVRSEQTGWTDGVRLYATNWQVNEREDALFARRAPLRVALRRDGMLREFPCLLYTSDAADDM